MIKNKAQNRLITLNGLMHTKNTDGCTTFKPSNTILCSLTASNLYCKRTATPDVAAATDSNSEVELELSY